MTADTLINLLFLAIAVVVFFRLRAALGKRTGNERPPHDPYASGPFERRKQGEDNSADTLDNDDNVIPLPGHEPTRDAQIETAPRPAYAPEGSALANGLAQIELADSNFTPEGFLDGAGKAHEMIVNAFSAADRDTLRQLLDDDVYRDFEAAIEDREVEGRKLEQSYVGLSSADITEAELDNGRARVTVRFASEIISALRAANGDIVEGSPEAVRQVVDVWTFERDTKARDPNWKVVATGGN
ncbi:Tim44/TimA family putative adaptor protein [Candidatus Phaeomarinobacter ectocarpi]|nr:Tim44/TimA family putative adaptor protein [Candidatus Phaeomarinobacter ectocarpi]